MAQSSAARRAPPVEEMESSYEETAFAMAAVEGVASPLMMVDLDFTITHVNEAAREMLSTHAEDFSRAFPGLDCRNPVGSSSDVFFAEAQQQRRLLARPLARPQTSEVSVGNTLKFEQKITSVVNPAGDYLGNILEWRDITEQLRSRGLLNAISRSQAVIEFDLDGVIRDANDNFLKTLGYTLGEVRGQRHAMFVDPAERETPAYREFWAKLGRGEYDAGQYKRIGKGGREVWIQASYNPILDGAGRAIGVVKYATDITAQKLETANFEGQLAAISKSQAIIEFDLSGVILTANENFLNALGYTLSEIKGQHHSIFVEPGYRTSGEYQAFWAKLGRGEYDAGQYKRIGKGGREIWIQASYNPILDVNGRPCKVVKYATDITTQRRVAERVKEIAGIVASASSEMRATAESMARIASDAMQQATAVASAAQVASSNVQTVSAAGEELSASISEIARQVAESSAITRQAVSETDKTTASIQTLAEAAQKIGNVVTLINNIAGQTKLLALNATIEAARAGDAGKGFAVVASEVKSLSDQTAKATHEISSQVSAMQAATATSVTATQEIAEIIRKVADIASTIASAVEEQSAATAEISSNVVEAAGSTQEVSSNILGVNEAVSQTSQASSELLGASNEMAQQAEALTAEMEHLLK